MKKPAVARLHQVVRELNAYLGVSQTNGFYVAEKSAGMYKGTVRYVYCLASPAGQHTEWTNPGAIERMIAERMKSHKQAA